MLKDQDCTFAAVRYARILLPVKKRSMPGETDSTEQPDGREEILIEQYNRQTVLSCSSIPDAAFFLRAAHLEEALRVSIRCPLIGIVETYIGSVGPICDAEFLGDKGNCVCLSRVFELPALVHTEGFREIAWETAENDLVRRIWQMSDGVEIYWSTLYRFLAHCDPEEEIREFMATSLIGTQGAERLYKYSSSVLPDIKCLTARAGISLYEAQDSLHLSGG